MDAFYYCLTATNIKKRLIEKGVVGPRTLHNRHNREVHFDYVLDMKQCHAEEWEKVERRCIEFGCVDYAKKNEDGRYGLRRDLTDREVEELAFWPIAFNGDDEMNWESWPNDDNPAFFVSKLFPDVIFDFLIFFQDEWDGGYDIKDGEFSKSQKWLEWIESDEYKLYHSRDYSTDVEEIVADVDAAISDVDSEDNLPF